MKEWKNWSEVLHAADKIEKDDNFITAYVDGEGIGVAATRSDDWAFIPIGGRTYMGEILTEKYYEKLKG